MPDAPTTREFGGVTYCIRQDCAPSTAIVETCEECNGAPARSNATSALRAAGRTIASAPRATAKATLSACAPFPIPNTPAGSMTWNGRYRSFPPQQIPRR